jgi:hypothetical protein
MNAIEALRHEESRLTDRLRLLSFHDPEARFERGEITERLREITALKLDAARDALGSLPRRKKRRRAA